MDWLEVIQTVALCANTILLLGIAFMLFTMWATFVPSVPDDFEDLPDDALDDEEEVDPLYVYVPPNRSKSSKRPGKRSGKKRKS